jgi:hypothetical protein
MSDLSRRSLVAGAASLPALTVPALASTDPVLTAIDRHNTALDTLCAARAREPHLEHTALGDQSLAAYRSLLTTPPTTDAGAAAKIRLVFEYEEETGELGDHVVALLKSLLAYLEAAPQ